MAPEASEISAALTLLKGLLLQGAIVTGDAMFCQRAICQSIRDAQDDYLFAVKANQPELMADLVLAFGDAFPPPELVKALKAVGAAPPSAPERKPAPNLIRSMKTVEKGHGRIETRQVSVSRECVAHLGWPGAAQVCRIERTREKAGRISREVAYALTSLTPEQADPNTLLALWRAHWLIENRLHWRRDVILHEDHSTVRSDSSPQAMAALRNAMLQVVRDAPGPLPETREILAKNRHAAIQAAQRGLDGPVNDVGLDRRSTPSIFLGGPRCLILVLIDWRRDDVAVGEPAAEVDVGAAR